MTKQFLTGQRESWSQELQKISCTSVLIAK